MNVVKRRGQILLYFTRGASELGGFLSSKTNKIEGENKYGRMLMTIAGGFNYGR